LERINWNSNGEKRKKGKVQLNVILAYWVGFCGGEAASPLVRGVGDVRVTCLLKGEGGGGGGREVSKKVPRKKRNALRGSSPCPDMRRIGCKHRNHDWRGGEVSRSLTAVAGMPFGVLNLQGLTIPFLGFWERGGGKKKALIIGVASLNDGPRGQNNGDDRRVLQRRGRRFVSNVRFMIWPN